MTKLVAVIILLLGLFSFNACSSSINSPVDTGEKQQSNESTPTVSSTVKENELPKKTTQIVSSIVKEKGLQGALVDCPESKGKLEVSHSIIRAFDESSYDQAPEIKVTIKNISNEVIEIHPDMWNYFSITIISKDINGQILGQESLGSFNLKPKEVKSREINLFSSDETKIYEINLQYRDTSKITGHYIESPEGAGKFSVNLKFEVQSYSLMLNGEIKNISSETLGGNWRDPSSKEYWYFKITYKDAANNIINVDGQPFYETQIATPVFPMKPGDILKFFWGGGILVRAPDDFDLNSFEMTIVKSNK